MLHDLQEKENEPMWFLILKLGKKLFEKGTSWTVETKGFFC